MFSLQLASRYLPKQSAAPVILFRRNSQGRSWQEEATPELPEGNKSSERVTHTLASGVNGGTVLGDATALGASCALSNPLGWMPMWMASGGFVESVPGSQELRTQPATEGGSGESNWQ
ncbi:hypothetical protein I7I51_05631 [Histoplasma capsulatum]|uniref:Uncharacterized protein n=1 Tax=Ajellomyces capsulatus TaxID=5037 RepID=A0A8A1M9H7_AJECA|nr:hypothetical protein I7I51_05631 [Histoplasma capsulatum]